MNHDSRVSRTAACGLILLTAAGLASAQSAPRRVTAPVRDAGVYHVDTGTWTRQAAAAVIGADVVYNNTCPTGYFAALDGDTYVDEGRLPSPTSPTDPASRPGCAVAYTIDGVQFAYCTSASPSTVFDLGFYQSYAPCSSVVGVTPTVTLNLSLPGSGGAGALACWNVTIDLGPQAFTLLADGDGGFTGQSQQNLFGWSVRTATPSTGPLLAGDPSACTHYDGTRWDDGPAVPFWPNNLSEDGTGMGTLDQFRIEGGPTPPGCYLGSGNVLRSFYLRLFSNACPTPPGQVFCAGDGSGTACPCGNASPAGAGQGCLSSTGAGALLSSAGIASLANDTLRLVGAQMPPGSSALFLQGTALENGGLGTVFGDGLRCAGGTHVRLAASIVSGSGFASYPSTPGQPSVSQQGLVGAPGLRTYQIWYRNVAPFCTPAAFNASNGQVVTWGT